MKTFLILSTTLVLVACSPSHTQSPEDHQSLVPISKPLKSSSGNVAKIFEVDENNKVIRQYTDINEKSEVVLKDVDKIRLECTSDTHPVLWLYQGNGVPVLRTNVTFTRISRPKDKSVTEFVASAVISPATEEHTGKYICSNAEQLDNQTYFYIYVPGPTLFSALNGQDIFVPENDTNVLLPCTTSSPDVEVILAKSVDGVHQVGKPSLWTYDPKNGVVMDINKIDEPEGIHICTARHNKLVRGIEYHLKSLIPKLDQEVIPENLELADEGEKCDLECNDNAHCEFTEIGKECICDHRFHGNVSEGCTLECNNHGDCPQNTVCYSDLKCRNPCVHSIRCGIGAECRVENAYPVCVCPKNFVGDPKKECFYAVQQDSPSALNSFLLSRCSKRCGDKAYCTIIQGKETCKCRHELEECGIPCESHDDCPEELSCNTLRKCQNPCIHNIRCGTGANCEVQNHRPMCFCPKNMTGDPMKECSIKNEYQGDQHSPPMEEATTPTPTLEAEENECNEDEECKLNEVCMKPGVELGKQCFDPCLTRRCSDNAICRTENHQTSCSCKDGFWGNASRKCLQISNNSTDVREALRRRPIEVRCLKPEECGPNSKCSLEADGTQKCECFEHYVGSPPNCRPECERNVDCSHDEICHSENQLGFPYCATVCGNKTCGFNSICGVISNDCECPVGFGGDPYLRCENLNLKAKLGQDCEIHSDCELGLTCIQKQCIEPERSKPNIFDYDEYESLESDLMY